MHNRNAQQRKFFNASTLTILILHDVGYKACYICCRCDAIWVNPIGCRKTTF